MNTATVFPLLEDKEYVVFSSEYLDIKEKYTMPHSERQGAQGWCTGMTQRDGMERKGGSGWGTCVHPWLIHVNVWQKPVQYCKVISLQLK